MRIILFVGLLISAISVRLTTADETHTPATHHEVPKITKIVNTQAHQEILRRGKNLKLYSCKFKTDTPEGKKKYKCRPVTAVDNLQNALPGLKLAEKQTSTRDVLKLSPGDAKFAPWVLDVLSTPPREIKFIQTPSEGTTMPPNPDDLLINNFAAYDGINFDNFNYEYEYYDDQDYGGTKSQEAAIDRATAEVNDVLEFKNTLENKARTILTKSKIVKRASGEANYDYMDYADTTESSVLLKTPNAAEPNKLDQDLTEEERQAELRRLYPEFYGSLGGSTGDVKAKGQQPKVEGPEGEESVGKESANDDPDTKDPGNSKQDDDYDYYNGEDAYDYYNQQDGDGPSQYSNGGGDDEGKKGDYQGGDYDYKNKAAGQGFQRRQQRGQQQQQRQQQGQQPGQQQGPQQGRNGQKFGQQNQARNNQARNSQTPDGGRFQGQPIPVADQKQAGPQQGRQFPQPQQQQQQQQQQQYKQSQQQQFKQSQPQQQQYKQAQQQSQPQHSHPEQQTQSSLYTDYGSDYYDYYGNEDESQTKNNQNQNQVVTPGQQYGSSGQYLPPGSQSYGTGLGSSAGYNNGYGSVAASLGSAELYQFNQNPYVTSAPTPVQYGAKQLPSTSNPYGQDIRQPGAMMSDNYGFNPYQNPMGFNDGYQQVTNPPPTHQPPAETAALLNALFAETGSIGSVSSSSRSGSTDPYAATKFDPYSETKLSVEGNPYGYYPGEVYEEFGNSADPEYAMLSQQLADLTQQIKGITNHQQTQQQQQMMAFQKQQQSIMEQKLLLAKQQQELERQRMEIQQQQALVEQKRQEALIAEQQRQQALEQEELARQQALLAQQEAERQRMFQLQQQQQYAIGQYPPTVTASPYQQASVAAPAYQTAGGGGAVPAAAQGVYGGQAGAGRGRGRGLGGGAGGRRRGAGAGGPRMNGGRQLGGGPGAVTGAVGGAGAGGVPRRRPGARRGAGGFRGGAGAGQGGQRRGGAGGVGPNGRPGMRRRRPQGGAGGPGGPGGRGGGRFRGQGRQQGPPPSQGLDYGGGGEEDYGDDEDVDVPVYENGELVGGQGGGLGDEQPGGGAFGEGEDHGYGDDVQVKYKYVAVNKDGSEVNDDHGYEYDNDMSMIDDEEVIGYQDVIGEDGEVYQELGPYNNQPPMMHGGPPMMRGGRGMGRRPGPRGFGGPRRRPIYPR